MGRCTNEELSEQRLSRINEEKYNSQGCLMKIVEYNDSKNIIIEFQDEYNARVHTSYRWFLLGRVKNPYYPSVYGIGMLGNKYPMSINSKHIKEYTAWTSMLKRCFDEKFKEKHQTYQDVTCCKEWLLYENYYEWLHNQENFEKWLNEDRWSVDKDISLKGNKVYSPETCCLVPNNVNILFARRDAKRGNLPIGVIRFRNKYRADCRNPFSNKKDNIGYYNSPEQAFKAYKTYKENLIKQVAEIEYRNGNITEQCYKAMMNYIVEITD